MIGSPTLPPEIHDAIDVQRRMQIAELHANAGDTISRIKADLDLAVSLRKIDAARRADLLAFATKLPPSRQKSTLASIRSIVLGLGTLKNWNGLVSRADAAYSRSAR